MSFQSSGEDPISSTLPLLKTLPIAHNRPGRSVGKRGFLLYRWGARQPRETMAMVDFTQLVVAESQCFPSSSLAGPLLAQSWRLVPSHCWTWDVLPGLPTSVSLPAGCSQAGASPMPSFAPKACPELVRYGGDNRAFAHPTYSDHRQQHPRPYPTKTLQGRGNKHAQDRQLSPLRRNMRTKNMRTGMVSSHVTDDQQIHKCIYFVFLTIL